jgi:hypothetical protein
LVTPAILPETVSETEPKRPFISHALFEGDRHPSIEIPLEPLFRGRVVCGLVNKVRKFAGFM